MYLDLGRWKQDLHGARMDPRPEKASLLQRQSTSQENMGDSEPPDILCESCACINHTNLQSCIHSTMKREPQIFQATSYWVPEDQGTGVSV